MNAAALCREFEGLALEPYADIGGVLTNGYGHVLLPGDPTGKIDEAQAEAWLAEDLAKAESVIDRAVVITLTRNEREALKSFVFNIGPGRKGDKDGFVTLKSGAQSTMLKCINALDMEGASNEFPKWCRAGGKKVAGLLRRRLAEQLLFNSHG